MRAVCSRPHEMALMGILKLQNLGLTQVSPTFSEEIPSCPKVLSSCFTQHYSPTRKPLCIFCYFHCFLPSYSKDWMLFNELPYEFTLSMQGVLGLSLIHICRCRRYAVCRSRWSPYH
eukprot:TRINITY_DN6609_c0_g1_i2.p2 TRINITY_DN6609_c0_g1~~TRINITY_DN6609_c0_g1_i2.p2  ORF type:complete len:117 (+),score=1.45 TRINITY_DN6609_c0_g1_i2:159-509(+)